MGCPVLGGCSCICGMSCIWGTYRISGFKCDVKLCDFPDLKQIAVKRMHFHGGVYRVVY